MILSLSRPFSTFYFGIKLATQPIQYEHRLYEKIYMIIRIILLTVLLSFSILSRENYHKCLNKTKDSQYSIFLSEPELNTIKSLFDQNHIDYNNYQFFKLKVDELGYHQLRCHQLAENSNSDRMVSNYDKNYYYHFLSRNLIDFINLNKRLLRSQSEDEDNWLIELDEKDFCFNIDEEIFLACLELEFGYYDLNAGKGYMDEAYTLVWLVEPIENPNAYFDFLSSNTISSLY